MTELVPRAARPLSRLEETDLARRYADAELTAGKKARLSDEELLPIARRRLDAWADWGDELGEPDGAAPRGNRRAAKNSVTESHAVSDAERKLRERARDVAEVRRDHPDRYEAHRAQTEPDKLTLAGLLGIHLGGLKGSEHVDWYTPGKYIDAAREVLGAIDLDPATSAQANQIVRAAEIFTVVDDGLARDWRGRVWLNPPYGTGSGLFTTKLVQEHDAGRVTAAVLLLNAYGFDSAWFQPLWDHPICFTDHRIEFTSPQHKSGGPANANIFVYLGPDEDRFLDRFAEFGAVVRRVR